MTALYSAALSGVDGMMAATRMLPRKWRGHGKVNKFIDGQEDWRSRLESELKADGRDRVWIHAASLGEYGVARPVIERLHAQGFAVVLTFFSSTGVEALRRNRPESVAAVGYLPLDTSRNAQAFLNIVQPQRAVFMVSEYWLNYLDELRRRNIPTYLVSALITRKAPFFNRMYGHLYRRALAAYSGIMVLTERSAELLRGLGARRVTVTGDPLFDNVAAVAATEWRDIRIERFKAGDDLFFAGSISDWNDLNLVSSLANSHPGVKMVFVPHEISEEGLRRIERCLEGRSIRYSLVTGDTDLSGVQVMIVDNVGRLAYMYRYATWAYVGGGFTPRLHSIIEASVYGVPTSYGPVVTRKANALELKRIGAGEVVETAADINRWFDRLAADRQLTATVGTRAADYVKSHVGVTRRITDIIVSGQ